MLSLAYLVFFLATFPLAMNKNRMFGFYYAALYIYSAFSIFGYLYIPGLSESISAYFGDEVGHEALLFTFASMAAFWVVNMAIYRRPDQYRPLFIASHDIIVTRFGNFIFLVIVASFTALLAVNFGSLSWYIFESSQDLSIGMALFLAMFKTMVGVLVIGYVIIRSPKITQGNMFSALYVLLISVFFIASIRLGNRTDPAAFLIGICIYESITRKLSLRSIVGLGSLLIVAVFALSAIEYFRYTDGSGGSTLLERVIQNDYYAPAHMLFAAVAFDIVDPIGVIRSNSANALVMFGEPYLQQTITELFREDVATRSAGYAFYIMTEGWMFAGWAGIVYNALIPSLGLLLWNRLGCTDKKFINVLICALAGCMILNVTRGQSSYFIKYLYTFVIPNLVLVSVLIDLRFRVVSKGESVEVDS